MNTFTLYEVVSSIVEQKGMNLSELAKKLNISEIQLARELEKNKKINKEFLMMMFNILDVSLIDNATNEKIIIHSLEDRIADALKNL